MNSLITCRYTHKGTWTHIHKYSLIHVHAYTYIIGVKSLRSSEASEAQVAGSPPSLDPDPSQCSIIRG